MGRIGAVTKRVGQAFFLPVLGLLLLLSSSCRTPLRSGGPPSLQALVDSELAAFPGHAGVYVKHLRTGEEGAYRADEIFNAASVIKLAIAARLLERASRGEVNLDERITLRKEDIRAGSGIFQFHDAGLQPTLRDVARQMIITSDNSATDIVIDRAGGVDAVNAWIGSNGFGEKLRLTQTGADIMVRFADIFRALAPGAEDAAAREKSARAISEMSKRVIEDREFWFGEMSPRAVGEFLERLERRALVTREMSELLLQMLEQQQGGASRLPHYLGWPEYRVAHKTGDWPPVLANDVGIVYTRSGPIVIAFCANAIRGNYGKAEDHIGRFARKVVEYFDAEGADLRGR